MKQVFCLLLITFSLSLTGCREADTYKTVEEKEFSELAGKENSVILDVRTPEEYQQGHLENALLVDYKNKNFENEINKLDPTKTYLVYCKAGGRSAKASSLLSEKGYNTYNLEGGISNWKGKVVQ